MEKNEHPAMIAAHASWRCVAERDREGWFALMSDEIRIEDPIGIAPTNPTGKGFYGKDEIAQFWEMHIGLIESISFECHESFAAGNESAHVLTLTTSFPGGSTMIVHGIFTYCVDEVGKLTSLRGYWSLDEARTEA